MAALTLENPPPAATQVSRVLLEHFGFGTFRPGQQEAIERLLAGRSVLAIFPTGSGKSLCYQLPALMIDGLTVVISPLIALMKDQIDFLRGRNIAAARLDSSLGREEAIAVYNELAGGRLRMLYISPERLGNERFIQLVARQRIGLLAVDEAHCISQWGHNFRPDYLKIAALADRLRVERVLALTATATPQVAADIACSFDIDEGDIVATGFYRPNLELRVTACSDSDRRMLLLDRLRARPRGPTIVYVTRQRTAAEVAAFLANEGFSARAYHAGLDSETRTEIQDAFMAADDMIVVATIAFGMGIDKANIRAVYHYNLPKGIESYMQEIGRAGRDGQPSVCEMLASADDVIPLQNFTYGDTPDPDAVKGIVTDLLEQGDEFDISIYSLSSQFDVREIVVKTLLTYLELEQILESTGPFYSQFKFQPLKPSAEILQRFDAGRQAFLRAIFQAATRGKTWFTLDVDQVAQGLGQDRERIIRALDFLEQQGDLIVQAAGVRHGFRRLPKRVDRTLLIDTLVERFLQREEQDIARTKRVLDFAQSPDCLTDNLLEYFGESHANCRHCGPCLGDPPQKLAPPRERTLTPDEEREIRQLCAQRHAALRTPRQLARFLCGIPSPATSRSKLRQHPLFGRHDRVPFGKVLELLRGWMG